MDYNKIRTFLAIVDCGSVSAAARQLRRTQSAISQQIQVLEAELGISLFQSLRGSVLLTLEGRKIYDGTSKHFHAIEACVRSSQADLQELSGIIRIGASPSIGHYYLANLVAEFNEKHPQVDIELYLQPDEQNESLLRQDRIDAAFIINFEEKRLFAAKPVIKFKENLVCSKGYIKRYKQKNGKSLQKLSDLFQATYIDFGHDLPNISHWLKKNSRQHRLNLCFESSKIVVEDNECVKRMVAEDLGLAMLPEYMIQNEIRSHQFLNLFPKSKPTVVTVDLALRKKKNLGVCLKEFINFVEEKHRQGKRRKAHH